MRLSTSVSRLGVLQHYVSPRSSWPCKTLGPFLRRNKPFQTISILTVLQSTLRKDLKGNLTPRELATMHVVPWHFLYPLKANQLTWTSLDPSTILLLVSRQEPGCRFDPAATAVHKKRRQVLIRLWCVLMPCLCSLHGLTMQDELGCKSIQMQLIQSRSSVM